jgi:hypothetical protein
MSMGNDPITTLTYDFKDWRKHCKRIDFDSPVWCLIVRDGTFAKRRRRTGYDQPGHRLRSTMRRTDSCAVVGEGACGILGKIS